jgi:two-component system phosphate regulon sensor histidine kinase PhoR
MSDGPPRILVVDDEFGIRESCRKVLVAEGYDVTVAEDGLAGLEAFRKDGRFAAVLIDLKMPRMGGMELLEEIRKIDQDVVLLVITAFATIETAVEATKRGAYGYIPKPFTPDELLLPVRNGLERRALSLEARKLREEREGRLLEVAFERSKSKTIINCMTDGVLVVNRDRQIVLANPAADRILSGCKTNSLPAPLDSLQCVALRELIAQVFSTGAGPLIVSKEVTIGSSTFMVNASSVVEPGGGTLGVVAVLRDITALKKLEVAKSMFISMVAHEIRSPLAVIEGMLSAVLSGAMGNDAERNKALIERAILRSQMLRTMISELLNITAMETGHFTLTRQPLDMVEVAEEAVKLYTPKAQDKHIELTLQCNDMPDSSPRPMAMADRQAILSVLSNLIDNAIKYTPEGGHVKVSVRCESPLYVSVSVQDDGIGVSAEDQPKLFDEFFRVRNEQTAQVAGTGLGLTVVKRLVEMHQGKVTVDSAPGRGSTFTVSIPLAEQES